MKAPNFWQNKNIISFILIPFSFIYFLLRFFVIFFSSKYKTNKFKIICIGNVVVGGSGKTPIAIEIGKFFKKNNIKYAFLSKGYKSNNKTFLKVDNTKHNYRDVGDEPILLSEIGDTFICPNRKLAIKELSKKYDYEYIIMDDGFQNFSIHKDINVLVFDGEYGLGNNFILPAGPLRENFYNAIDRADLAIIINNDKFLLEKKILDYKNILVIKSYISELNNIDKKNNYIAFSGIGRNEKFFNSLLKQNINVVKKIIYDDHHIYSNEEIENMIEISKKDNCKLITTKKDWVKFSDIYKKQINYLDIEIKFINDNFIMFLKKILNYA